MTTSEAIEGMTDAGEFEILATRVLRQTDPDCYRLSHLGVNAQGKTVSTPIDGFGRVPNTNPPTFVMAAFTIASVAALKDKWLLNTAETPRKRLTEASDGDLVKATRTCKSIRAKDPDARFVVHLCTNIEPPQPLRIKAEQFGNENGMEVLFLTRSQIRDHLDTNPQGQYLRKIHLGIECELLSPELLLEISEDSVRDYEATILRPIDANVSAQLKAITDLATPASLTFLAGTSGQGKSSTCVLALKSHLRDQGPCLRIPEEVIAYSQNLAEAIGRVLLSYRPNLKSDVGFDALSLSSPNGLPLLLVFDDLNKTGNPSDSARKLISWTSPARSKNSNSISAIAPLWDNVALQIRELNSDHETPKHVRRLRLGHWSNQDSVEFLRRTLTDADPRNKTSFLIPAAKKCFGDPILLSSLATVALIDLSTSLTALADGALERYIDAELQRVAGPSQTAGEFRVALIALAKVMVLQRDFRVSVPLAMVKLANQFVELKLLCQQNTICRLVGRSSDELIEFKHDRLLEFFAVLAFGEILGAEGNQEEIFLDPYYAGFVAQAYLNRAEDLPNQRLIREAPLVLVECLGRIKYDDRRKGEVLSTVRSWLAIEPARDSSLECEQWLASRILAQLNSPSVLAVTEDRPFHYLFREARMANGDFQAGLAELGGQNGFELMMNYSQRDEAIERAVTVHRQTMKDGCLGVFLKSDASLGDIHGSLALAGFLQEPELASVISESYSRSGHPKLFDLALWSCLRSGGKNLQKAIQPLVEHWLTLPEEIVEDKIHRSPRNDVGRNIGWAMKHGLNVDAVSTLVAIANDNEGLRFPIGLILERLTTPEAIRYVVTYASEVMAQGKGWLGWPYDRMGSKVSSEPRSMIDFIKAMAFDESNKPWLTEGAKHIWIRMTDSALDLSLIKQGDAVYKSAIWYRIRLGDSSAVGEYKRLYNGRGGFWKDVAQAWTPDLEPELDLVLQELANKALILAGDLSFDEGYDLATCLRDIDQAVSVRLLKKHWHGLRKGDIFVIAALYLGDPDLTSRAAEEISCRTDKHKLFKYSELYFGFLRDGLRDRIQPRHIKALEPYVQFIDDMCLDFMIRSARQVGMTGWPENYVRPIIEGINESAFVDAEKRNLSLQRIQSYARSDDELISDLEIIANTPSLKRDTQVQISLWWYQFEHRQDPPQRLTRIVAALLLDRQATLAVFAVVAELILNHGLRADVEILCQWIGSNPPSPITNNIYQRARIGVFRRSLV